MALETRWEMYGVKQAVWRESEAGSWCSVEVDLIMTWEISNGLQTTCNTDGTECKKR